MSTENQIDLEQTRKALDDRRAELIALDQTAHANGSTIELDQTKVGRLSRMDAIQSKEMESATHQRRTAEIKAIAAALERIETGEYGYCVTCGEAIAPRRLETDPAVAQCINCAR